MVKSSAVSPIYEGLASTIPSSTTYTTLILDGDVRRASILQPSQLEVIARDSQIAGTVHQVFTDFVEDAYQARQKPYFDAGQQLDRIQTLPARFAEAKALIQKYQEESEQLKLTIADRMRQDGEFGSTLGVGDLDPFRRYITTDEGPAKDRVRMECANRLIDKWLHYGLHDLTFIGHDMIQNIPGIFVEDYDYQVAQIGRAIKGDTNIFPHLTRVGDYFFVPETEAMMKFTGLLSRAIQEMRERLASKDPIRIASPSRDVCEPIHDAFSKYGGSFACSLRKIGEREDSIAKRVRPDRFFLNEKAVEVLRQYPIVEAQKKLEAEVEKIGANGVKRKQLVAAKIDVEVARYSLDTLSRTRDMEYVLKDHERAQGKRGEFGRELERVMPCLTDLLNASVTVSRNTGAGYQYKVDAAGIDTDARIRELKTREDRLGEQIRGYDMDLKNLRGSRVVLFRERKIAAKRVEKETANNQLAAATKEKTELQAMHQLSRLLSEAGVAEHFAGMQLPLGELLAQAQERLDTSLASLGHLGGRGRELYQQYQLQQGKLKAAEERLESLRL